MAAFKVVVVDVDGGVAASDVVVAASDVVVAASDVVVMLSLNLVLKLFLLAPFFSTQSDGSKQTIKMQVAVFCGCSCFPSTKVTCSVCLASTCCMLTTIY